MFEDILRAAKKANGENFEKPTEYSPPAPLPQYDAPTKWYEKKWGIGLLLIICFPLGAILLWQNPRYSNQVKGGITAGIIFLFLFYRYNIYEPPPPSKHRYESTYTESSYDVSYLPSGALWIDDSGQSRKNSSRVKVEVTDNTVVMADGSKKTQIYFLEGSNAGTWGYVNSSSLSK